MANVTELIGLVSVERLACFSELFGLLVHALIFVRAVGVSGLNFVPNVRASFFNRRASFV